jgi:hypothetical protein
VRRAHELPGGSARTRATLALLVLCAILLGSLIAGTPVNLDESHAARTAGINLTTPPTARAAQQAATSRAVAPIVTLLVLTAGAAALVAMVRRRDLDQVLELSSVDLTRARSRRGPPALV